MRRHRAAREWPSSLATFTEADWLAAPLTDDERDMFGDADEPRLAWSLAMYRWGEARVSWAQANLGSDGWFAELQANLATPLYTRPRQLSSLRR